MPDPVSETLDLNSLGEIYRIEKKSSTISIVRKDLYPSMVTLVLSLKTEYEEQLAIDPDSIVCEGINQRKRRANKLSKEVVEIRMNKITLLALRGAMGAQNVITSLTNEEREFYTEILETFRRQETILNRLGLAKNFKTPTIIHEAVEETPVIIGEISIDDTSKELQEISEEYVENMIEDSYDESSAILIEEKLETPTEDKPTELEGMAVVRILEDLPAFSGPDRDYELSKEDIVRMPTVMANILIQREKATLISPAP